MLSDNGCVLGFGRQATQPIALQGTIETWMLLEYADKGSLEEAIQNKSFQRKSDNSQLDMVRCHAAFIASDRL